MSLIANARMYAVTPGVREAWQRLFDWMARTSGVPLEYIDHAAPAPLETLWAREDLGATFMCGFPFALAPRKPGLIAAPVPSPPRYGGMAQYCTDFIVRADRPFARLSVRLADASAGRWGIRNPVTTPFVIICCAIAGNKTSRYSPNGLVRSLRHDA
jgi:hypothetical protein